MTIAPVLTIAGSDSSGGAHPGRLENHDHAGLFWHERHYSADGAEHHRGSGDLSRSGGVSGTADRRSL